MSYLRRVLTRSYLLNACTFLLIPGLVLAYDLHQRVGVLADIYIREIEAAVTGALALAILLMYRRWRGRLKRLEAQRNELALAVMLRTREIRREKQVVEQQKQQIEELLKKAQASNEAKDEFLANISHEIRTPLHGVLGMTDLTLHTSLTEEQREYLELVEKSAKSLLALLNDVLDFSKIEAGGLTLECAPFSIRECVESASAGFGVTAKKKGLEFQVDVSAETPEKMDGDALRLRQVLVNLISNALKFTERGSIHLDVSVQDAGNRLQFRVQDTGIGIPQDQVEAVFEPFRQVDGSTTRKYGGTGLGLSICLRLAKQMGGELTLESEEGRGSTFTLQLPVARSPECVDAIDESQSELTSTSP